MSDTKQIATYYFEREKDAMERELKALDEYKIANDFLRKHNWLFISPLFFQGYQLSYFADLSKQPGDQKAKINQMIFNKFFDLGWTASFTEGYCIRCTYIAPFLPSIENSIILTFQRDYEGAIKTLIPIVEGILRKYLCHEHGMEMSAIQFKHIRQSFSQIKRDLLISLKESLSNWQDDQNRQVIFSEDQKSILLDLNTQYEDYWFSFIGEFIDNSLYLNTKNNKITNEINRHAILHEYGLNFTYDLENYIKIYFVLYFLTWAFLRKEKKSLLNKIESFRAFEKSEAYRKIIQNAERMDYQKHLLLKNHPGYNAELLKEKYLVKNINIPRRLQRNHNLFVRFHRYLWEKGLLPQKF